jgi:hypothetical protein
MKREIQYVIFIATSAAALIAYAHANFQTKETANRTQLTQIEMRNDIREIRQMVWKLYKGYESNK